MEDYHNRVFRYLSYDEERVLTEIIDTLDQPEKNIVSNIINKFSMPKTGISLILCKLQNDNII